MAILSMNYLGETIFVKNIRILKDRFNTAKL